MIDLWHKINNYIQTQVDIIQRASHKIQTKNIGITKPNASRISIQYLDILPDIRCTLEDFNPQPVLLAKKVWTQRNQHLGIKNLRTILKFK